jgi:DNA primase catalytic core
MLEATMARIPEEEIERLKSQISLERLAEAKGVTLKKHGENLLGLCPFHDDREPSLVITPSKNLWHCLGACQMGGTVIDWVMKAEGVRFRHAVELLREGLPSLAAFPEKPRGRQQGKVAKKTTTPKLPTFLERSADDDVLLRQVVDYYEETLKQSPEALQYLEKRGLRSSEMIEHFHLGFANRTLAYRLPQKNRKTGAELRGRLQALGILRESGHEHLNGSLVVPVFDEQSRVTEMYGRKVNDHLREGTPMHLYLPGPHRGVFNLEAFENSKEIILCEALIDALTFWCAGHRNVTASYGVEGFIEDHRAALRKYGTERVYVAYDRDDAGDRAAEKLATELAEMGIEVMRVVFPKGMDANEYALKVGPAEKSLGLVLRQAEWMAGKRRARTDVTQASTPPATTASSTEPAAAVVTISEPARAESSSTKAIIEPAREEAESLMGTAPVEPELVVPPSSPSTSRSPEAMPASVPITSAPVLPAPLTPAEISHLAAKLGRTITEDGEVLDEAPPEPPLESPPVEVTAGSTEDELVLGMGDRRWRVRGLAKATTPGTLRVNLLVTLASGTFHVDTLELYSARQRGAFLKQAAEELGIEERILKRDLGEVLLKLEEQQEKKQREGTEKKRVELTDEEQQEALELLRNPQLLDRLLADFERCGVVGEQTNKLVGYLAATSRKLDEPLAVIIQSSSAAGKSSLMDAILALTPEEERVEYSAMTGQSLFYMGETNLRHKILAIVEEEGAERAAYALKLLQSEGELTIASTGKDPATGRLVTHEYRVEGPVMIFLTTTAIEVDEELLNRCLVLTVDEGREQTRAIHRRQREAQTLEGLLGKLERERIVKLHQNAQRLLRPLFVANPFAQKLTFLDHQTRTRRDHLKYLTLIRAIALLHQYQRPVKTAEHRGQEIRYIEVTEADIRTANRLAHEVLGRSLDELPPQTRKLLVLLDGMVAEGAKKLGVERRDFRFSRRLLREHTGWGDTQLKVHLGRLVEMEYVIAHRASGYSQRLGYELVYERRSSDGPFLAGLISADELGEREYDENRSGAEANRSGQSEDRSATGRALVGGWSAAGRGIGEAQTAQENSSNADRERADVSGTHIRTESAAEVVAMPSRARRATPVHAAARGA